MADGSCPRCEGFLHSSRDIYGDYMECLQCGFMKDLAKRIDPRLTADTDSAEDVA